MKTVIRVSLRDSAKAWALLVRHRREWPCRTASSSCRRRPCAPFEMRTFASRNCGPGGNDSPVMILRIVATVVPKSTCNADYAKVKRLYLTGMRWLTGSLAVERSSLRISSGCSNAIAGSSPKTPGLN